MVLGSTSGKHIPNNQNSDPNILKKIKKSSSKQPLKISKKSGNDSSLLSNAISVQNYHKAVNLVKQLLNTTKQSQSNIQELKPLLLSVINDPSQESIDDQVDLSTLRSLVSNTLTKEKNLLEEYIKILFKVDEFNTNEHNQHTTDSKDKIKGRFKKIARRVMAIQKALKQIAPKIEGVGLKIGTTPFGYVSTSVAGRPQLSSLVLVDEKQEVDRKTIKDLRKGKTTDIYLPDDWQIIKFCGGGSGSDNFVVKIGSDKYKHKENVAIINEATWDALSEDEKKNYEKSESSQFKFVKYFFNSGNKPGHSAANQLEEGKTQLHDQAGEKEVENATFNTDKFKALLAEFRPATDGVGIVRIYPKKRHVNFVDFLNEVSLKLSRDPKTVFNSEFYSKVRHFLKVAVTDYKDIESNELVCELQSLDDNDKATIKQLESKGVLEKTDWKFSLKRIKREKFISYVVNLDNINKLDQDLHDKFNTLKDKEVLKFPFPVEFNITFDASKLRYNIESDELKKQLFEKINQNISISETEFNIFLEQLMSLKAQSKIIHDRNASVDDMSNELLDSEATFLYAPAAKADDLSVKITSANLEQLDKLADANVDYLAKVSNLSLEIAQPRGDVDGRKVVEDTWINKTKNRLDFMNTNSVLKSIDFSDSIDSALHHVTTGLETFDSMFTQQLFKMEGKLYPNPTQFLLETFEKFPNIFKANTACFEVHGDGQATNLMVNEHEDGTFKFVQVDTRPGNTLVDPHSEAAKGLIFGPPFADIVLPDNAVVKYGDSGIVFTSKAIELEGKQFQEGELLKKHLSYKNTVLNKLNQNTEFKNFKKTVSPEFDLNIKLYGAIQAVADIGSFAAKLAQNTTDSTMKRRVVADFALALKLQKEFMEYVQKNKDNLDKQCPGLYDFVNQAIKKLN